MKHIYYNTNLKTILDYYENELNKLASNLFNITKNLKYEFYKKDEFIFRVGNPGEKFYLILNGGITILKIIENEKSMTGEEFLQKLIILSDENEKHILSKMVELNRDRFKFSNINKLYEFNEMNKKRKLFKILKNNVSFDILNDFIEKNYININSESLNQRNEKKKNMHKIKYQNKDCIYGINLDHLRKIYEVDKNPLLYSNVINNIIEKNFSDDHEDFIQLDRLDQSKKFIVCSYEKFFDLESGFYFGDVSLDRNSPRLNSVIGIEAGANLAVLEKDYYLKFLSKEKLQLENKKLNYIYESFFKNILQKSEFEKKYFKDFIYEELQKDKLLFNEKTESKFVYFICSGKIDLISKKDFFKLQYNVNYINSINILNKKFDKKNFEKLEKESLIINNQLKKNFEREMKICRYIYLKKITNSDILGLENCVFNYPFFYEAIVKSEKLIYFKIENKSFKKIISRVQGADIHFEEIANRKIDSLLFRLNELIKYYLEIMKIKYIKENNEFMVKNKKSLIKLKNNFEDINDNGYLYKSDLNKKFSSSSCYLNTNYDFNNNYRNLNFISQKNSNIFLDNFNSNNNKTFLSQCFTVKNKDNNYSNSDERSENDDIKEDLDINNKENMIEEIVLNNHTNSNLPKLYENIDPKVLSIINISTINKEDRKNNHNALQEIPQNGQKIPVYNSYCSNINLYDDFINKKLYSKVDLISNRKNKKDRLNKKNLSENFFDKPIINYDSSANRKDILNFSEDKSGHELKLKKIYDINNTTNIYNFETRKNSIKDDQQYYDSGIIFCNSTDNNYFKENVYTSKEYSNTNNLTQSHILDSKTSNIRLNKINNINPINCSKSLNVNEENNKISNVLVKNTIKNEIFAKNFKESNTCKSYFSENKNVGNSIILEKTTVNTKSEITKKNNNLYTNNISKKKLDKLSIKTNISKFKIEYKKDCYKDIDNIESKVTTLNYIFCSNNDLNDFNEERGIFKRKGLLNKNILTSNFKMSSKNTKYENVKRDSSNKNTCSLVNLDINEENNKIDIYSKFKDTNYFPKIKILKSKEKNMLNKYVLNEKMPNIEFKSNSQFIDDEKILKENTRIDRNIFFDKILNKFPIKPNKLKAIGTKFQLFKLNNFNKK